ncbi:dipeptidyl aminopeptidase/acylaminoacyl peptidase [Chryseobacterium defluvii]|uniref:Dipeptidyl aminopeptidase/acylaminoacyl peptidase n=1 Tax=Chryseobacterium defluvii TaxID=160396 RepID=A0A840KI03_9FLAO|nr:acyl-CoA thioester hydrolase/BAAT C-terminal domain-containing protein [Chryseobacterium defluvii]MBB4807133.1 dipeptidyl aminopeptidase/acylaminoacyl peptidase [Chryseobacterium defluvii]
MKNFDRYSILLLLLIFPTVFFAQIRLKTPNVESILYLGKGKNQPLIVGLGGSEGGNAWAGDYWKKTRDQFIEKGYAFLALGYFKAEGTPEILDKIEIEDVYNAIEEGSKNKQVNKQKIAIIGGSRGADLALLLGSYYENIRCVVSIVGSNVVFPGHTDHFSTPCWTFQRKELSFVPVNDEAVPFLMKRDLRGAFESMLKDSIAAEKAIIKIENIKGPVLFLSATKDEICPSTPMAETMMERLKNKQFKFNYEHKVFEGSHSEPLKHFDLIYKFLEANFAIK